MLEERIGEWRSYVLRRQAIDAKDVDELEDHLRTQVADLREAGLDEEEAFLIAVKRLGDLDSLSREYAQEYSERLWKRLVVAPEAGEGGAEWRKEALVAVGLAVAAGVAIKVPELFGMRLDDPDPDRTVLLRPELQPLRAPVPRRGSSHGSGGWNSAARLWLAVHLRRRGPRDEPPPVHPAGAYGDAGGAAPAHGAVADRGRRLRRRTVA